MPCHPIPCNKAFCVFPKARLLKKSQVLWENLSDCYLFPYFHLLFYIETYTVSSFKKKKKVLPSWEYYPIYYLQIPVFPLRKFEVVTLCPPVGKTEPSDQKMDFALLSIQILTLIGVTTWTFKTFVGVWLWLFVHCGLKRWICNSEVYVANLVLVFSRVFGFYLLKPKKNKICKFVQVQSRK